MDRGVHRAHDRQETRHPPQPRRLAAERGVRRHARLAYRMDPALVRRLLAARAERALAGANRARGAGYHDWRVLGPGRKARLETALAVEGIGFSAAPAIGAR